MRVTTCALVAVLIVSAGHAAGQSPPSARTAQAAKTVRANLKEFRVQIICFDPQLDRDRTVDVSVTDRDEDFARSAAGLMTQTQAQGVLDALVADGFFDRAKVFAAGDWNPPPPPFYVIQVRTGEKDDLFEHRVVDAKILQLLVHVRTALVRGAAARSADSAIAAIDPKLRKWAPVTQPASKPAAPMLPNSASPLHPGYTFEAIDPAWEVDETFLKPAHGEFVSQVKKDEPSDEFPGYFRELEYRDKAANQRTTKTVTFYPSGKLYLESDSHLYGVDLPMGDTYRRMLAEDGKMIAYVHSKDGKDVDGWAIAPDGSTDKLVDGLGRLRHPTFDPKVWNFTWYYQGLPLVSKQIVDKTVTHTQLRDNTEWGKAAALEIAADGSETLYQDQDRWTKSADGSVKREALYTNEQPTSSPAQFAQEYRVARLKFDTRFIARVKAAGYKLEEMGIASFNE